MSSIDSCFHFSWSPKCLLPLAKESCLNWRTFADFWLKTEQNSDSFPRMTYSEAMTVMERQTRLENADNQLAFVWIIDFPLFLPTKTKGVESCHHPFTARNHNTINWYIRNHFLFWATTTILCSMAKSGRRFIRIHDHKMQEFVLKDVLKKMSVQCSTFWTR